jgi:hypothetical protein
MEADTVREVKCYNCDQTGHRVRDCKSLTICVHNARLTKIPGPIPRVDKFACKNCGFVFSSQPLYIQEADSCIASLATRWLSVRSRARLPTWSAANAVKVGSQFHCWPDDFG